MSPRQLPIHDLLEKVLDQRRLVGIRARRLAGSLMLDTFFNVLSRAGRFHPVVKDLERGVQVLRDLPYLSDGRPEHLLDIYLPTGAMAPLPVVLYIHGGGFRILSKDSHWVMGLAYARQGYLVCNINYRLAPRQPFPAALEDAVAAMEWVVKNVHRYGGDPDRLVLAGESAGANLATSLTIAACYQRNEPCARAVWNLDRVPRAVVAACGALHVSDIERFASRGLPDWILDRIVVTSEAYLGPGARFSERRALADPLVLLESSDPPQRPLPSFFVPVGTKDPLLDDTRRLKAVLDRMEAVCEARYYEGEVHAFHALIWREGARRCWQDTFSFLDRYMGS
jgi:acetyl esterase